MLGLQLIEQFALLMVILFISLEWSPGLFTPTSGRPAAVFGQRITLMDGGQGGGKEARLETGAPGRRSGWASWEEGAGLSWARPLTLGRKRNVSAAIGSLGLRRWRLEVPAGWRGRG